jgi:hypothetical protein
MHSRRHSTTVLLLLLVFFTWSCTTKHHEVIRGFYYWKTIYRPSPYETDRLRKLQVHKMYLRFFDVDDNENLQHPIPIAPMRMEAKDSGLSYIPVVFITQNALIEVQDSAIRRLAQSICALTTEMCRQYGLNPDELQIDCDWTAGTKIKYFSLLQEIKKHPFMKGKRLSCTIRMNQVKYQNYCGIPPADRGLVMAYGMGNIKKPGDHNSILNPGEAKDYLKYLGSYPLSLDIALPLFEWCVLFREQQFRGILRDISPQMVSTSGLFAHEEGNVYTCVADSTWHGCRFKKNDLVRLESPAFKDILTTAEYVSARIKNNDVNVILFACDSLTLSRFSTHELETIYSSYN